MEPVTYTGRLRPAIRQMIREAFEADSSYGRGFRVMARVAPTHGWTRLDELRPGSLVRVLDIQVRAQFGMFKQGKMRPIEGGMGKVEIIPDGDSWTVRRISHDRFAF